MQAARILATLIVYGSGAVIRACSQAYRQALASKQSSALCTKVSVFFCLSGSFGTSSNKIVHNIVRYASVSDASKSGVAQEAMHSIKRGIRGLTEPEARQILGVTEKSSWEEILKVCFSLLASLQFFLLYSS